MASQTFKYFLKFIKDLKELDQKEKEIVISRLKGKTLNKISRRYRLSAERIRQIENEAINKINKKYCQLRLID